MEYEQQFLYAGNSSVDILKVIEKEIISFQGVFDEFTLWNYNKDAAKNYKDSGSRFPNYSILNAVSSKQIYTNGQKTISVSVDALDELSSRVVKVMVAHKTSDGKKVKKATFKLNNFTGLSADNAIRAVIYTNDGKSYTEYWRNQSSRVFDFSKGGY